MGPKSLPGEPGQKTAKSNLLVLVSTPQKPRLLVCYRMITKDSKTVSFS